MTDEGLFLVLSIALFSCDHWLGGGAALIAVFLIIKNK